MLHDERRMMIGSPTVRRGVTVTLNQHDETPPVYVIESIPLGGDNEIPAEEIAREGIPTPPHLRFYQVRTH